MPELAIYRNCLELLKAAPQDILYLDDRAENVEAAARLGINSVLFDTVEKTASRVESRFDIPVRVMPAVANQVHSTAQQIGARMFCKARGAKRWGSVKTTWM
jgi:FMN phosphatase YigB (HAD superfamily)